MTTYFCIVLGGHSNIFRLHTIDFGSSRMSRIMQTWRYGSFHVRKLTYFSLKTCQVRQSFIKIMPKVVCMCIYDYMCTLCRVYCNMCIYNYIYTYIHIYMYIYMQNIPSTNIYIYMIICVNIYTYVHT